MRRSEGGLYLHKVRSVLTVWEPNHQYTSMPRGRRHPPIIFRWPALSATPCALTTQGGWSSELRCPVVESHAHSCADTRPSPLLLLVMLLVRAAAARPAPLCACALHARKNKGHGRFTEASRHAPARQRTHSVPADTQAASRRVSHPWARAAVLLDLRLAQGWLTTPPGSFTNRSR